MDYSKAHELADQIRQSPECREYQSAKELIDESDTAAALIKEYQRAQFALQMSAAGGRTPDADLMKRFQQLSALLYAGTDTSRFLMAQMRLQTALADIYGIINKAAGLDLDLADYLK